MTALKVVAVVMHLAILAIACVCMLRFLSTKSANEKLKYAIVLAVCALGSFAGVLAKL
jgi:hypothetical protein